jgi:hypothetical protein
MTKSKKLQKKIQKMAAADLDIDVLAKRAADEPPMPPAETPPAETPPAEPLPPADADVPEVSSDDLDSDDSDDEDESEESSSDDVEDDAAGPSYAGPEVQPNDPNQAQAPQPTEPGAPSAVDPGLSSDSSGSSDDSSISADELGAQLPGVAGNPDDPTNPTPVEAAIEEMIIHPIAEVVDEKTAQLEMFLFDRDGKHPAWLLMADQDPFAKICLADQQNPEMIRQAFCADSYADTVLANAKKLGLMPVLADVKARFYHAQIFKSQLSQRLTKKITAKVEKRVATANDKYAEKVQRLMHLVVKAAATNFFKDPDTFKSAMVQSMRAAGVENPKPLVEKLFLEHAPSWFKTVLAKANDWATYNPDAMKQIRASIEDMGVREVDYDTATTAASDARDQARHAVASSSNEMPAGVPLATQGMHSASMGPTRTVVAQADEETLRQQYRDRLRGLRHSRRLAE